MTTFIGIDLSLNSTGLCIIDNDIELFYIIKPGKLTKKEIYAESTIPNLKYITYNKYDLKQYTNNSDKELYKTYNIINIVDQILNIVKIYVPKVVCLEGLSYGSRTNTLCDLAGLNYLVRQQLINSHLIIATPSEVKKFYVGIGNANKELLCNLFKTTHPTFDIVPKLDDIVDAHALANLAKYRFIQDNNNINI